MNLISVLDERGELSPTSREKLTALAMFPEDDISWKHAWRILELEAKERLRIGPESYRPSQVASTVINLASKRSSRAWVAGLVALAYFGFRIKNGCASLNQAVDAVCRHTGGANKYPFVFYEFGVGDVVKEVRMQSDHASVRQIFKEYRKVAHICAARVSCNQYLETLQPFDEAGQADRCYLATVIAFQDFFHRQFNLDWGLRLVSMPGGIDISAEALMPTEALMADLLGSRFEGS